MPLIKQQHKGFTLIEMLVVMTIIGILLTLVTPRYFASIDRSKEKVLRHDLIVMRTAIDQFYGDNNLFPNTLQDLVDNHYLREVPIDPITERRDSWRYSEPDQQFDGKIADVHSGSELFSSEGTAYAAW